MKNSVVFNVKQGKPMLLKWKNNNEIIIRNNLSLFFIQLIYPINRIIY